MADEAMRRMVKKIETVNNEEQKLFQYVSRIARSSDATILDVGCGYGRNIVLLQQQGYSVLGVEANKAIVEANRREGITCLMPDEFDKTTELFDVVIMSHVIEHFLPDALLEFMEHYLSRLKSGGHLILATPLHSPYFYDDFDHVKPYSPVGINMVFGGGNAQVQYYGRTTLELADIWFRRSPFRVVNFKGRFTGGDYHIKLLNMILAVLFKISFHRFGRCDGWMGLYAKK